MKRPPASLPRSARCVAAVLCLVAIVGILVAGRTSLATEPRPNVLLIISDDQGYGDFGFNGNKLVRTPNLDRLAAESAVFRNFVVAPACSPTRAAIYTGRDHLLTGVWGVPPRANLRRDEALMPAFFQAAGYRTLHVGKEDCVKINESMPWERGWDESIGGGNGYAHRDPVITRKSGSTSVTGWTADILTEHAVRFIREHRDQRWFASVAYIIPHTPWVCDQKYSAPFVAQGCSAELAACYGSIAQMDECIGKLLDALGETGQDRSTVVAFVSDNGQTGPDGAKSTAEGPLHGTEWDQRNVARLRGSKATVWENGIRVPLVVRWPGRIKPGERKQFGCAEDILPTLLELSGVDSAATPHLPFTGVSLAPALVDAKFTFERPDAFRMAIAYAGSPHAPTGIVADPRMLKFEDHHFTLRGPRFKYHALPGGKSALYDLDSDPGETRDVQANFSEVAAKMADETRKRWNELISSGRAFRMPSALVRGDTDSPPPNNRSRVRGTAVQSITGSVRVAREAIGFARAGDSASYALEVAKPGVYDIVLGGEGLDACAPLTLELDGRSIAPTRITPGSVTFAKCELLPSAAALRVQAGQPAADARPAKLRWITFFMAAAGKVKNPADRFQPRLMAGPEASLLLDGKPYRGIGVNYFNCFLRTLKSGDDTSYDAGFATLAAKGIPFARFCATGFWPRDMKLYVSDRAEYFRRLDGVVNSAQKHGIGLVPSLFWYYACVPDLVGEPMDEWANPASKTQAWMRQYVREVVTRYRDHPCIWAWEFGNEYALAANLPNAAEHRPKMHPTLGTASARSARDDLTFDQVRAAYIAFAAEVRKYDPNRLIVSGDSFPRRSAWHQDHENSWKHDTTEQFAAILKKLNPDPLGAISLHMYRDDDERLATAMQVSRRLNKPLFVGEFGGGQQQDQAENVRRLLRAVVEKGVPLSALWVFDHAGQPEMTVTAENSRSWQLDAIADTQRKLEQPQTRPAAESGRNCP